MVFAHGQQPSTGGVYLHVGVARLVGRRQRLRHFARPLAVEALVGVVGEVDYAVVDGIVTAAVLVGAGAGVEVGWGHVFRPAIGEADDDVAAALRWATLQPVDVITVETRLR